MRRTDNNQADIVKVLRSVGVSVYVTSQIGNGFPDLVCGIFGKNFLIEVKNEDTRGRLTPEQEIFIEKWKGKVYVVKTVDEALNVIGIQL